MRLLLSTAAVVLFGSFARGEELQPQWISKDARWLAHFDIESALASPLFSELQKLGEFAEVREEMAEVEAQLGFNPLSDVHAVTVYSAGKSPEDAVAFVVMSHAERALAKLGELEAMTEVEASGFEFRSVGGEGFLKVVPIEEEQRSLVVISERQDLLVNALNVLAGETGNMTAEGAALKARPGDGAYFFATAGGLDGLQALVDDFEPASRFTKGARDLVVQAGESQGKAFFGLQAQVEDANVASQLQALIQGVRAFAALAPLEGEEAEHLRKLLGGLETGTEGKHFHLRFAFPTAELKALLKAHAGG